jgi:hypothetical protein
MLLPKSTENWQKKKSSAKSKAKQLLPKSIENQQKKSIAKTLLFPSLILDDDEEQEIICFG